MYAAGAEPAARAADMANTLPAQHRRRTMQGEVCSAHTVISHQVLVDDNFQVHFGLHFWSSFSSSSSSSSSSSFLVCDFSCNGSTVTVVVGSVLKAS